jgi:hypothetical protein
LRNGIQYIDRDVTEDSGQAEKRHIVIKRPKDVGRASLLLGASLLGLDDSLDDLPRT